MRLAVEYEYCMFMVLAGGELRWQCWCKLFKSSDGGFVDC